MKTQKGYILPIILIVILLALAGFFLFSSKPVESPAIEETPTPVATSTKEDLFVPKEVNNEDVGGEQIEGDSNATTTVSIEGDVSIQCIQNEDCLDEQVCYFKPGVNIGACTDL